MQSAFAISVICYWYLGLKAINAFKQKMILHADKQLLSFLNQDSIALTVCKLNHPTTDHITY